MCTDYVETYWTLEKAKYLYNGKKLTPTHFTIIQEIRIQIMKPQEAHENIIWFGQIKLYYGECTIFSYSV